MIVFQYTMIKDMQRIVFYMVFLILFQVYTVITFQPSVGDQFLLKLRIYFIKTL